MYLIVIFFLLIPVQIVLIKLKILDCNNGFYHGAHITSTKHFFQKV